MKTIMILLAALLLAACLATPFQESGPAVTASVGDTLHLERGAVAEVGDRGFRVRFAGVDMDSRCPRGVDCVWEGDAEARILSSLDGGPWTAAVLHTHADSVRQVQHAGYVITLIDVEPYPTADDGDVKPIPQDRYVAVLVVSLAETTAMHGSRRIQDRQRRVA
jgi:hypothetical protein